MEPAQDVTTIPLTPAALADPVAGCIRILYFVGENQWDALDLPYTPEMTFRLLRALAALHLNIPHDRIGDLGFVNPQTHKDYDLDEAATPCATAVACNIMVFWRERDSYDSSELWIAYLNDASSTLENLVADTLISVSAITLRWRALHLMLQDGKVLNVSQLAQDLYHVEGIPGFFKGSALALLIKGGCWAIGGYNPGLLASSLGRTVGNVFNTALVRTPLSSRTDLASALFCMPSWTNLSARLATFPASAVCTVLSEFLCSSVSTLYEPLQPRIYNLVGGWTSSPVLAEVLVDLVPKALLLHPVRLVERCVAINLPHSGPLLTLKWLYTSGNLFAFVWQEVALQVWMRLSLPLVLGLIERTRRDRALSLSLTPGSDARSVQLRVALEGLGRVAFVGAAIGGAMWFLDRAKQQ